MSFSIRLGILIAILVGGSFVECEGISDRPEGNCKPINNSYCICETPDKILLDLSKLDSGNETPKFQNATAVNDGEFYYNPCSSFKLGQSNNPGSCNSTGSGSNGVAVCRVKNGTYENVGIQEGVQFYIDMGSTPNTTICYFFSLKRTCIQLICKSDQLTSTLTVNNSTTSNYHSLTLVSQYACLSNIPTSTAVPPTSVSPTVTTAKTNPPSEKNHGLSTGGLFLILFFVGGGVYLIGGMVLNRVVRGAEGIEMIPHLSFWVELPALVRDGCIYVINGCKPPSAYDSI